MWMFEIFSLLQFILLTLFLLFAALMPMAVNGSRNIYLFVFFFFFGFLGSFRWHAQHSSENTIRFRLFSGIYLPRSLVIARRWSLAAPAAVCVGKQIVNILHSIQL